jgi:hypothetical protein
VLVKLGEIAQFETDPRHGHFDEGKFYKYRMLSDSCVGGFRQVIVSVVTMFR